MDYLDILKRAWNITWRYKALWVLGFFAAAAGGSGGGGNPASYSTGAEDWSPGAMEPFFDWMAQNWVYLAIVGTALFFVGVIYWVLSIAAQGGLVHAVNEAAEGRQPSLGPAWRVASPSGAACSRSASSSACPWSSSVWRWSRCSWHPGSRHSR